MFRLSRVQKRRGLVSGLRERREDEMRRFLEDKDRVFGVAEEEVQEYAIISAVGRTM